MKKGNTVSSIMTRDVISVQYDRRLSKVVELFRKHKIRHLPVLEVKKVVGVISRTDMNRLTFGTILENQDSVDEPILNMLSIEQVMTSKPKTVSSSDSIKEVAEILASSEYHALPVEDKGDLVGIVTTTDLIKYMLTKLD